MRKNCNFTSKTHKHAREKEGIVKNEDLPRKQRDHALFAGYYPHINPRFGFSIVVEHGGSGSKSYAPIARDLCNKLKLIKI